MRSYNVFAFKTEVEGIEQVTLVTVTDPQRLREPLLQEEVEWKP